MWASWVGVGLAGFSRGTREGTAGVTGKSLDAELAVEPLLGVRARENDSDELLGRTRTVFVLGFDRSRGFDDVEGS